MEISIYYYALCVSLTLMLFFSYRFIFGKLPDLDVYRRYRMSRTLMGAALLVLSANYVVHLFLHTASHRPGKGYSHEPLHIFHCGMAFLAAHSHTPRQEHGNPQEIHQARKRLGHIHRRGGGTLADTSPGTPTMPFPPFSQWCFSSTHSEWRGAFSLHFAKFPN